MGKFVANGPATGVKPFGKNGAPKKTGVSPSTAAKTVGFPISGAKQKTSKIRPQRG